MVMGWGDGKAVKILVAKSEDLSSAPEPAEGRREPTPSSCPLTSSQVLSGKHKLRNIIKEKEW